METGPLCDDCACDRWEAAQPEREQRERERLDSEGYYDDPDAWHKRKADERAARDTTMTYDTVLTVEIVSCLLGFQVNTYNVRVYENGFTQGQGFKRSVGLFTAHDLITMLIWTEEPFRVTIKGA